MTFSNVARSRVIGADEEDVLDRNGSRRRSAANHDGDGAANV